MADFIDRTELLRAIKNFNFNICCARATGKYKTNIMQLKMFTDIQEQFLLIAEGMPKADTERHAHWIFQSETSSAFDKKYKCSKCNRVIVVFDEKDLIHYPYCNCGCKMDEVTGNE